VSQVPFPQLLSNIAVSALAATIMPSWAQIKQHMHMQQRLLLSQAEEFGRRLAHQFPWSPSASVALGLALRRRYLGQVGAPSLAAHRKQIIKVHHHTLLCAPWQWLHGCYHALSHSDLLIDNALHAGQLS